MTFVVYIKENEKHNEADDGTHHSGINVLTKSIITTSYRRYIHIYMNI